VGVRPEAIRAIAGRKQRGREARRPSALEGFRPINSPDTDPRRAAGGAAAVTAPPLRSPRWLCPLATCDQNPATARPVTGCGSARLVSYPTPSRDGWHAVRRSGNHRAGGSLRSFSNVSGLSDGGRSRARETLCFGFLTSRCHGPTTAVKYTFCPAPSALAVLGLRRIVPGPLYGARSRSRQRRQPTSCTSASTAPAAPLAPFSTTATSLEHRRADALLAQPTGLRGRYLTRHGDPDGQRSATSPRPSQLSELRRLNGSDHGSGFGSFTVTSRPRTRHSRPEPDPVSPRSSRHSTCLRPQPLPFSLVDGGTTWSRGAIRTQAATSVTSARPPDGTYTVAVHGPPEQAGTRRS